MVQRADTLEAQTGARFMIWAESRADKKAEKRIVAPVLAEFGAGMHLSFTVRVP